MPDDCGARANREERDGAHTVEFSFSQVVELYERSGIAQCSFGAG
jgi:hypothetical protein